MTGSGSDSDSRGLDLRRGEQLGSPPVEEKLDHCLTHIEKNGFADGIDWDTEIAKNVTVEEMLGAMVHAENELVPWGGGDE